MRWAAFGESATVEVLMSLASHERWYCKPRVLMSIMLPAVILAFACDKNPYATIQSPADGTQFAPGDTIWFHGEVNSPYPLGIEAEGDWRWTSDLDGELGETALFSRTDLSLGEHLITLRVRNDRGVVLRDQVRILIEAP
jgi:hypothetical protein